MTVMSFCCCTEKNLLLLIKLFHKCVGDLITSLWSLVSCAAYLFYSSTSYTVTHTKWTTCQLYRVMLTATQLHTLCLLY